MVNRPESSSTRSDKSSSSSSKSMHKSNGRTGGATTLVRSKSGNDYKLRNSSSMQSIASKTSDKASTRSLRKFKSSGR